MSVKMANTGTCLLLLAAMFKVQLAACRLLLTVELIQFQNTHSAEVDNEEGFCCCDVQQHFCENDLESLSCRERCDTWFNVSLSPCQWMHQCYAITAVRVRTPSVLDLGCKIEFTLPNSSDTNVTLTIKAWDRQLLQDDEIDVINMSILQQPTDEPQIIQEKGKNLIGIFEFSYHVQILTKTDDEFDPEVSPTAICTGMSLPTIEQPSSLWTSRPTNEQISSSWTSQPTTEQPPSPWTSQQTMEQISSSWTSQPTIEQISSSWTPEPTIEQPWTSQPTMEQMSSSRTSHPAIEQPLSPWTSQPTIEHISSSCTPQPTIQQPSPLPWTWIAISILFMLLTTIFFSVSIVLAIIIRKKNKIIKENEDQTTDTMGLSSDIGNINLCDVDNLLYSEASLTDKPNTSTMPMDPGTDEYSKPFATLDQVPEKTEFDYRK